ncbi:MAG: rhodanese-related sulfurtransferase [Rhodobacter sp.]|nr:rhodanese-related sulfurtransferase [Rhodobacter sp.]
MLTVVTLYRFTPFEDPAAIKPVLSDACLRNGVRGSILLAHEGINGTIAGDRADIGNVLDRILGLPGCDGLEWKESHAARMPFRKMKVRIKKEIVTMGRPDVDPRAAVGKYVVPERWNRFIRSPDVSVIDVRNRYELAIGTFEGSIDPGIDRFGEFPDWWETTEERFRNRRVAMFCTGGIRCEKATNYLIGRGFREVYHLKGGILKYLDDVPEHQSEWRGECYVFDGRVSVGHGLAQGTHSLCHACGRPVGAVDRLRPEYEEGVRCPSCVDEYGLSDRERFRERQRQIDLARSASAGQG